VEKIYKREGVAACSPRALALGTFVPPRHPFIYFLHIFLFYRRDRTPEAIFSPEKIAETVPRPNASDGEYLSRGRSLPSAQSFV
jgi:hypothetical protein